MKKTKRVGAGRKAVHEKAPGTHRSIRVRSVPPADLEGLEPDARHAWRHDNIGRLFVFAFHAFEERLLAGLHERGHRDLKYIHLNLFRNLDYETGTRIVDLARRVGITKAAIGQLAREGERLGYFSIESDPTDARAKIVAFTPAGKVLHADFRRQILKLESDFRQTLGATRYESLRTILLRLRTRLVENR